ncbi:MAG: hypothetical protein PHN80_04525 [Hespellia sp.]|nr:hypothetical protein [Hespellia sp.]
MKRMIEYLFVWTLGGCLYYGLELTFRNYSHWTMFVLGGTCFWFFYAQGLWTEWKDPLWRQVLRCSLFVTAGEFTTGIIVNKLLGYQVWDYSDQPLQLFGQICVPFIIIFSGLSALGILLCGGISHWIFGEKMPHFHVL